MNREIKFRAWDKAGRYLITSKAAVATCLKQHILGYPEKGLDGQGGDYSNGHTSEGDRILIQYTGLKDKNGKEIYEGDVVKYKISAKERFTSGEVIFKDLAWVISGKYRDIKNNEEYMRCLDESDELEIIGNIYENPELL